MEDDDPGQRRQDDHEKKDADEFASARMAGEVLRAPSRRCGVERLDAPGERLVSLAELQLDLSQDPALPA
jgi:hypothetical protein